MMMGHAKTEDIEIFLTVVDTGSFTGAANLLNQQVAKVSSCGVQTRRHAAMHAAK
ncbi:LysR family transcriptional regulator [Psychrobacter sp. 4Bb]|uniref:LysR family transcriptional regulator n=1 Tax=Psychrobacter sp. 4Bb TaxID=888436 RepID=UPI001E4500B7|nr:LysR family transcriptional regulator [Psychrobacter sp. 4Bb]